MDLKSAARAADFRGAKVQMRRSRVQKCKGEIRGRGWGRDRGRKTFQVAGGSLRWRVAGRRRAAGGRGTIYRALLMRRARRSHAPTLVRPAANGRADHPWSAAVEQGCSTLPEIQIRTARGAVPTLETADGSESRPYPYDSFLSSPVLSPSWTSRMSMRLSMLTQRLLIGVSFW
jgi:hypothetical protein